MDTPESRLKKLRVQFGFSQQQIADKLSVTKSTISKYEKGLRRMKYEYVEALIKLYGQDTMYVLTGTSSDKWQEKLENEAKRAEEDERGYWEKVLLGSPAKEILTILEKLNEDGQKKAIERITELAEIPRYQKAPSQPQEAPLPPDSKTTPTDK